jgi:hypothetical protein
VREIAEQTGVGRDSAHRAKQQVSDDRTPEPTIGRDGKSYPSKRNAESEDKAETEPEPEDEREPPDKQSFIENAFTGSAFGEGERGWPYMAR